MARREGSNIDHIRASIVKKLLEFTSKTLEYLSEEGGLTYKSAQAICEMLLPGINGVAVAITDTTTILGYAGASEDGNPSGRAIRTQAHGVITSCGDRHNAGPVIHLAAAGYVGPGGDNGAIRAQPNSVLFFY